MSRNTSGEGRFPSVLGFSTQNQSLDLCVRLGFLPAERWLVYVTGGLAVGESKYNMTFAQPGAGRFYSLSDNETKVGWTAGGGVETALARNWTAKLEYLYVDLGTHSIDTVDVDGAPFHVENKIRNHVLRAGLNYKFN